MKRLPPLLALVLAGCPSTAPKDAPEEETACGYSCCNFTSTRYSTSLTLTAEELAKYIGKDGELSDEECERVCTRYLDAFQSTTCDAHRSTEDGGAVLTCSGDTICEGRRPAALLSSPPEGQGAGGWFARAAHAEAASVYAFRRLRRELAAYGAPTELCETARAAAADEVRHARTMHALATAHGGQVQPVRVGPLAPRLLVEIAEENAVEGCVHETWAAVVALYQAREATEPAIAEAMATVAADEARHAELAHAVHRWALTQLTATERRRVVAARRGAVKRLATITYPALVGLPGPAQVRALRAGMIAHVWGAV